MKRVFPIAVSIFCLLGIPMAPSVSAIPIPTLSLESSTTKTHRQDTWETALSFQKLPRKSMAAFRVVVQYDPQVLTLKRVVTQDGIASGDFRYTNEGSAALCVYATSRKGISEESEVLSLSFDVKDEAPIGSTTIHAELDQVADGDSNVLAGVYKTKQTLDVVPLQSSEVTLSRLVPDTGDLEPAFSPERLNYTMDVPYEVKSLTFDLEAQAGSTTRVNRKSLNTPGTPTLFLITVVSSDGKKKTQYSITVSRQETAGSTSALPGSGAGGISSAPQSSSASSSRTNASKASPSKTASRSSAAKASASASRTDNVTPLKEDPFADEEPANFPSFQYGDRYLSQNTNQMPAFLVGVLCSCVCLLLGIVMVLVWDRRKGGKSKDSSDREPSDKEK